MNQLIKLLMVIALALPIATQADSVTPLVSSPVDTSNVSSIEAESKPFALMNFKTMQKDMIERPFDLTDDQGRDFVPQVKSSQLLYDQYLSEGYLPFESVFYTYFDLVGYEFNPIKIGEKNK